MRTQEFRQRGPAPEFDMTAVPQRCVVVIPFVRELQRQILQVTVIWRRDEQMPAGPD